MDTSSATEWIESLKQGRVSSRELVDDAIRRIEKLDPVINAVVVRDFERARAAAARADAELAAHHDKPLLGLPVTVKEGFDVQGLVTSWGLPGDFAAAEEDSVLVQRLRAAGAIVLGKSNVATMLADWQTANPRYGRTNNPWNVDKTPGGSSGGGAAAIAAGLVALEFGSDLAGSLRIPASFCGVSAHRPSHGIVPMRGFAPPMAPRLPMAPEIDQFVVGPIARTARDLELALRVVAGPEGLDATAWRLNIPAAGQGRLRDFRVLVVDEHPLCPTSTSIRGAMSAVAATLEKAGCTVAHGTRKLPSLTDVAHTFQALLMSFMGTDTPRNDYDAAKRAGDRQSQALTMSHRDWVELDRRRLGLQLAWTRAFAEFDVVLCPATPVTAFDHDSRPHGQRQLNVDQASVGYDVLPLWSSLGTPAGLPSTTVPIDLDDEHLPIGMQVIAERFQDLTSLRFAALLQENGCALRSPGNVGAA